MLYRAGYENSPTYSTYGEYVNAQKDLLDPYSMLASTVAGIGNMMDSVSEQKAIQAAGREDLADYIVGDEWTDIFNNADRRSQGLKNIDANKIDVSNINNIDNLKNIGTSNNLQDNVNYSSPDAGQVWGDTLGDMGKFAGIGASIGSIIPGVGTAIGAGVGALAGAASGILRGGIGSINNMRNAEVFNDRINKVNDQFINDIYDQAGSISQRQQREWFMHTPYQKAEGGYLEGLNGVIHVNEGGTHESNPNEGVQMGVAPDNLPNLVEEGEIVYKDYVYSNRLKPSKKLLEDNLLPKKYVGLTFAEIADKLQKESEDRPNDPISLQTLNDWMSRLQTAQETHKMRLEDNRMNKALDELDLSQDMFAKGGKIHIKPENRGKFTALKKRTGKSASWFKEHGTPAQKKMATFALNSRKWNHKHEFGGHTHGGDKPWETGYLYSHQVYPYTANYGFIPGILYNDTVSSYNGLNNPVPFKNHIDLPELSVNEKRPISRLEYVKPEENLNNAVLDSFLNVTEPNVDENTFTSDDVLNIRGTNNSSRPEYLRYAPAVGAGISALTAALQPKDYSYANRLEQLAGQYNPVSAPALGGYRAYTPYDVNLGDAENLAIQAAALRANRGQNRATQAALNTAILDKMSKANSERNLTAQQANEANRLAVDTYNKDIDERNTALTQAYDQLNQQTNNNRINMLARAAAARDASDEAWANMLNTTSENLFNQLGKVGRDNWVRNQRDIYLRDLGYDPIALLSLFNLNRG